MISKSKENGIVYTPNWIVKTILDLSKFNLNIFNKKILEPSCGEGAFLVEIVDRIILDCKKNKLTNFEIQNNLTNNIFAFDIDSAAIEKTKIKLNSLLNENNINSIEWENIQIKDFLNISNEILPKFDFIFGNPPYIRIQNLSEKNREYIQKNYKFCNHGSTDIYIAFFEKAFHLMSNDGILGYITPNTFLNSSAGLCLRNFICNENILSALVDFEHYQIFNNVTTYSLISIFDKNNKDECDLYKGNKNSIKFIDKLNINQFSANNWILNNKTTITQISSIKNKGITLGELCKIHTGIATLKDELFIFHNPVFDGDIATITLKSGKKFKIERKILKKIIKASTWKNSSDNQNLFIIFPYKKNDKNKHTIINEEELKQNFPLVFKYLSDVKKELLARDKGKNNPVAWYAFGRSQGIDTVFGKKIITSAININPNFIVCEEENVLYYAGYSIVYDGDLQKLAEKLNSNDMKIFIDSTSRNYQGGYKSYAKSFIKNFGIDL